MAHLEGTFGGSGGLALYYQAWRPDGAVHGAVGIVHGIGEHSGRYGNVVNHLIPRGFAVWAYDHRGHGRSQGRRVHVDRWSQYLDDLHVFRRLVGEREPQCPLFLYGHSMGALILLEYLTVHQEGLAGAVISGAPIQPVGVAKPALVVLARVMSPLVPALAIRTKLDVEAISRDPQVVEAYRTDRSVYGTATVRWGTEALGAVARVNASLGKISLPVLLVHGGGDRLNAAEGARWAFERLGSADKTLRIYPDTYHEPHNDTNFREVLGEVGSWLSDRAGREGRSSG